jgi:hypothetical protein
MQPVIQTGPVAPVDARNTSISLPPPAPTVDNQMQQSRTFTSFVLCSRFYQLYTLDVSEQITHRCLPPLREERWNVHWTNIIPLPLYNDVKVKLFLCLTMHHAVKTYGAMEVQPLASLTSPADGGDWTTSRLGRSTPGETAADSHWLWC